MADLSQLDELHIHQKAALSVLDRALACIDDGPQAVQTSAPALRGEMAAVLGAYQIFKHTGVFDPAIASGDDQRVALARHMKVACIAAGEVFRAHQMRWKLERIDAEWTTYKPAARLTVNQIRRHIVMEAESIAELIETYG